MNWQLAWPGTRVAQVKAGDYVCGAVYVFTLVPSGRPKRGNLYYNPKSSGADPVRIGNEITFAQAKQLAKEHHAAQERRATAGGATRLEMARTLMAEAKMRWGQWTNRHSSSPHRHPLEWREYMKDVAHPLNSAACEILIDLHSHLPREEWPGPLQRYVRYVEDYDLLIAAWAHDPTGNTTDETIGRAFPYDIDRFVQNMKDPDVGRVQKPRLKRLSRVGMLLDKE